jgi:tryptophan-rich sensory protein
MTAIPMIQRDERTIAVENASYRWTYLFLSYGLLVLVAYRSFVQHESAWDLLALVVVGGILNTAYQGFHVVLSKQWAATCLLTVVAAGVLAALVTWLR